MCTRKRAVYVRPVRKTLSQPVHFAMTSVCFDLQTQRKLGALIFAPTDLKTSRRGLICRIPYRQEESWP